MSAIRYGNAEWDIVLRASAVMGLAAIPIVLLIPASESIAVLMITTIWMRGPASALMPVGLEPVLMLFGRLHPPLLVAIAAAIASAMAEILSLHMARGVLEAHKLERIRGTIRGSRIMALFNRSPFFAVAFAALSPIPDWITRTLAAASRYSSTRYVIADTVGRFPKLWAVAALGNWIVLSDRTLVGLIAASVTLALAVGAWRLWRRGARRLQPQTIGA